MPTYDVDVQGKTYEVTAPDPNTAWRWASQHHKDKTDRMAKATAADQQRVRDEFKADTEALPWGERALANVGAGMDTLIQGAKQLGSKVGLGDGVSDEELRASREMKSQLADSTAGGGLLQTAGEIAPTLAIPGGVAMGAARRLPGALAARAAANAPRALAIAEGAAVGAGTGALMPTTSDESRLFNTGMGALGGGVGTALGGFIGDRFRLLTRAGREQAKLEKVGKGLNREIEAAGESPADIAARLRAPKAGTKPLTRDIPVTAAERSGSTALARAELAHRGMAPDLYAAHGRMQNEAIWDATQRAGAEGVDTTVSRLHAERDTATGPMRDEALKLAGRWSHVGEPLQAQVETLWKTSTPGSPKRGLAKLLADTLSENPDPAQLYEFRKLLTNKLSGPMMPGDDVAAIVKGSQRDVMTIVKAIDDRLDEAADNKWSPYLMEYADRSQPVTSARAQQQITEQLSGAPTVGNAPQVTAHRLKQAVGKYAQNKQGFERLTPEARARYDELTGFLDQIGEPMRAIKLAGTGGGGSQTAMQTSAVNKLGMQMANAKMPGASAVLRAIGDKLGEGDRRALAEMLTNPEQTAAAIRAALTAGAPLTVPQRAFLAAAQSAGTGAALALTPTQ